MFTGLEHSDYINAKHIVFQEPITSKPTLSQTQNHNVYFRPQGHPDLKKFQHDHCDEAILYSVSHDKDKILSQPTSPEPNAPPVNESEDLKNQFISAKFGG